MEAIKGFIEVTRNYIDEDIKDPKCLISIDTISYVTMMPVSFEAIIVQYGNTDHVTQIFTKESYEEIKQLIINAQK